MSIFEIIMLVCFGAAWPFSIAKSIKTRRTDGKSLAFLVIVIVGYASGIINKLLYKPDFVVWLYALNATMVSIDAVLWLRNRRLERQSNGAAH
ncbi:MAG TPA: hypothetical protein VMX33_11900 [bacterium]|nr:hypothetical protein [bacterium]